MSFGAGSSDSIASFKSFVSEGEIEEKRKKRQEEWEKVRKPEDPEEAPEEAYDPRCLYDQLQDQKNAKDLEFDEKHKLSNQVKGLEEDEVEFLDYVSQKQEEFTKKRDQETDAMINEYRDARSNQVVSSSTSADTSSKKKLGSASTSQKKSQSSLLAGAIKRKSTSESDKQDESKRKRDDETEEECGDNNRIAIMKEIPGQTAMTSEVTTQTAQVVAILPGIGNYTDSDDTTSSSGSEEEIDTDLMRKLKPQCTIQTG